MRRLPHLACVFLSATTMAVAVAVGPSAPAHAAPVETFDSRSGPLGPVTVIGDSILMGAALYSPTLPSRLVEQGWGPVRLRAGEGYSTGQFGVEMSFRSSFWINQWRSQGWDPPNVIVNLGANDSGFCNVNLACAREAIMHLVDTIGPGHKIWWPQITRLYTHQGQQDTWNLALQQIADERDDFYTWDWPTVMASGPFPSSDGTHLAPEGYRRRSQLMAEEFTADIAVATRVGGDAPLAQALGAPSEYVPLAPERIVDTRSAAPGRLAAGGTLTVDLADHVPPGTTAVAVNLTATQPGADGFLTAHPCDRARRDVSSVNYPAGGDRGAMAVIPLAAAGTLCVYSDAASHVIVDLQGAFVPAPGDDGRRFQPLSTPSRIADTRNTGRTSILTIPVPAGADAVAVNLTATAADVPGFLTAYPCGAAVPNVSNVNFGPTEPVAGSAFVPTSDDDTICVAASTSVDVIVDITGSFIAGTGLRFVPAEPSRMIDTRSGVGGWAPIHGRDQTIDSRVAPAEAEAVTGTLTIVAPVTGAFLTAYGCGTPPATSSVNADARLVLANALTVGVSAEGRLCLTASAVTHSLFDTTGWWVT
ncbi:MAG TPA: SGNH/GDSL hydrolase family protein [Ilumatobacteraceae bacterium]|nr:SGNH/GDSL hydrolase family protein [Ilumatobacteraceae bacterium]